MRDAKIHRCVSQGLMHAEHQETRTSTQLAKLYIITRNVRKLRLLLFGIVIESKGVSQGKFYTRHDIQSIERRDWARLDAYLPRAV